jgi:replicative DNA helicase
MSAADVEPSLRWERTYVATVLAMPRAYDAARVSLDDIGSAQLRGVLDAVLALHTRGDRVTRTAMRAELERSGSARLIGTLDDLGEVEPDLAPVAQRIREHAHIRRLRVDAARLTRAIDRGDMAAAREAIGALSLAHDASADRDPVMSMPELLAHTIEEIQAAQREQRDGGFVTLPIPTKERLMLAPGTMCVLGAQTNVGKSSLLSAWLLALAHRGTPVGLISVEDPAADWGAKALADMSGVNSAKMWEGMDRSEWGRLSAAIDQSRDLPLSMSFVSDRALDGVLSRMEFMVRVRGARMIAVDYLQAISHRDAPSTRERIDRTVEELLAQAGRLRVPLVLASQLSRPDKGNPFREPNMIDLKESGSIENRAASVILLWRADDKAGTPTLGKVAKAKRKPVGARFTLVRDARGQLVELADEQDGHAWDGE